MKRRHLVVTLLATGVICSGGAPISHAQTFTEMALAGAVSYGNGSYPQAQISALFPEGVVPEPSSAARHPHTPRPTMPTAPVRHVYLKNIDAFGPMIRMSDELNVLGYPRPSNPPLGPAEHADTTAVQMQLTSFAHHLGTAPLNVTSDYAAQVVKQHFVNAERAAIRRARSAQGELSGLAGVYRMNCDDLGYGKNPPDFPRQAVDLFGSFDLYSQWILYFHGRTMYAAMLGTTRFRPYPVQSMKTAPTVRNGVVLQGNEITFIDADGSSQVVDFLPGALRISTGGERIYRTKCAVN